VDVYGVVIAGAAVEVRNADGMQQKTPQSGLPNPELRERWVRRRSKIARFFVRKRLWKRFPDG
jgi:hypothetical protein